MRIERVSELNHPVSTVVDWMQHPGALVRLTPPGLATLEDPAVGGLEEGRVVAVRLGPSALPMRLRPRLVMRYEQSHLPRGPVQDHPEASPYRSADDTARALADPVARFVDRQLRGPLRSVRHERRIAALPVTPEAPDGRTAIAETVEVEESGAGRLARRVTPAQIEALLDFRARQMRDDLAFWAEHPVPTAAGGRPLVVAMTGSSGLVGTQLAALLRTGGIYVVPMRRAAAEHRPTGRRGDGASLPEEIWWDPHRGVLDPDLLAGVDAVVHLAGASIATRFTSRAKERIRSSRVDGSQLLARTLANLAERGMGPRVLVQASAIGVYGAQRPGELLTEDDDAGTGFLASVVRDWEAAAKPVADAGIRTVLVRTGAVLSDGGGMLAAQLPLFRLGVGGRITKPKAICSWITLDDLARVYAHALLTDSLDGPVNAVAPAPASAEKMACVLGRVLHRPARLPVPAFGPRMLLGAEGALELVEADQAVSDELLRGSGFTPAHARLEPALHHVLWRTPAQR